MLNPGDTMSGITYLKGDATCPQAKGSKLICHVYNDVGGSEVRMHDYDA